MNRIKNLAYIYILWLPELLEYINDICIYIYMLPRALHLSSCLSELRGLPASWQPPASGCPFLVEKITNKERPTEHGHTRVSCEHESHIYLPMQKLILSGCNNLNNSKPYPEELELKDILQ